MFIVALFTVATTWKQPRCPSTDDWIKKMWYNILVHWVYKKHLNSVTSHKAKIPASNTAVWIKDDIVSIDLGTKPGACCKLTDLYRSLVLLFPFSVMRQLSRLQDPSACFTLVYIYIYIF